MISQIAYVEILIFLTNIKTLEKTHRGIRWFCFSSSSSTVLLFSFFLSLYINLSVEVVIPSTFGAHFNYYQSVTTCKDLWHLLSLQHYLLRYSILLTYQIAISNRNTIFCRWWCTFKFYFSQRGNEKRSCKIYCEVESPFSLVDLINFEYFIKTYLQPH